MRTKLRPYADYMCYSLVIYYVVICYFAWLAHIDTKEENKKQIRSFEELYIKELGK